MKLNYCLLILLSLFISCSSNSDKPEKINEINDNNRSELVGMWQNESIIVRMPDSIVHVPKGKWESILGIKPIETTFNKDGSYNSIYRSLEDSVFMTNNGDWQVDGDSLTMTEGGKTTQYYYSISSDTVFFRGYLDWDQDGKADDHYVGKQVRVKQVN